MRQPTLEPFRGDTPALQTQPTSQQGRRLARAGVLAAGVLVLALLAVPGAPGSLLGGSPLGEEGRRLFLAIFASILLVCAVSPVRGTPRWPLLALLALGIAKVGFGSIAAPLGWRATFEMRDPPPAQATFFWNFRPHSYRIDPEIDFAGPTLGLHFLNDLKRYGTLYSMQSRDVQLPLGVTWTGFVRTASPGELVISAAAHGTCTISVNGRIVGRYPGEAGETQTYRLPLAPGEYRLDVSYDKPAGVSPSIAVHAAWASAPLDVRPSRRALDLSIQRNAWAARASDATVWAGCFLWILVLAGAYRDIHRDRPLEQVARGVGAWAGGVLALRAVSQEALPLTGRYVHLWSGDDPLAYVGNALDILRQGLLMNAGLPLGEGTPFYFYPLYTYFLAGVLSVVGEDFPAVQLANGLCLATVPLLAYALAFRDAPARVAWPGLVLISSFVLTHCVPYAAGGLSDNLFIVLVFVAVLATKRVFEAPTPVRGFALGLAAAAAAATRPSFLTFTPMVLLVLVSWRPLGSLAIRGRLTGSVMAGFVVGLLPFALRNLIVAGRFVVLVSSWIQIPYFLIPPEVPNTVPARLGPLPTLGESVRFAVEIVREAPGAALLLELRKVVFTLGFMQLGPIPQPFRWDLFAGFIFFLVALVLRSVPRQLGAAIGVFSVSHMAAMVLAAPWTYGYKTILPFHAVLLCGAVYVLRGRSSGVSARGVERVRT